MFKHTFIFFTLVLTISVGWAKESLIGNDVYVTGDIVSVTGSAIDSVFAIGEIVNVDDSIKGSVHVLARNIIIRNSIEQNLYAVGETISIDAPILKDANLAADTIFISANIGNDLRAAANSIDINSIGGDLLVAAKNLNIKGTIAGSAALAVSQLNFSPSASIKGYLTVYLHESSKFNIPDHVIPPERITYKRYTEVYDDFYIQKHKQDRKKSYIVGLMLKILFITLAIFAVAMLASKKIKSSFERGWQGIWSSLGYGFLMLSLLAGGVIMAAVTLIGIPLSILLVPVIIIVWLLGYFMGNYFIVSRIWQKVRKQTPANAFSVFVVALLSSIAALLIINVPWIGWWLMIVVTLFGVGAMTPCRCQKSSKSIQAD